MIHDNNADGFLNVVIENFLKLFRRRFFIVVVVVVVSVIITNTVDILYSEGPSFTV